jgi:hypothetical protein
MARPVRLAIQRQLARSALMRTVSEMRDLYMQCKYVKAYFSATPEMVAAIDEQRSIPVLEPSGEYYQWVVANGVHYNIRCRTTIALEAMAASVAAYEILRRYAEFDVLSRRRPVRLVFMTESP